MQPKRNTSAVHRVPAPHVQNALAAAAQPKRAAAPPQPAAHVQSALAAAAQPKRQAVPAQPAAHVRTAVAQAHPATQTAPLQAAAHVLAASAQVQRAALPPARPAAPFSPPPSPPPRQGAAVLQTAKRPRPASKKEEDEQETKKKRKLEDGSEITVRKSTRETKVLRGYTNKELTKEHTRQIKHQDKIETERAEKRREENLKRFREQLDLAITVLPGTARTITYGTQQSQEEVKSLPIGKDLMQNAYAKMKTNQLNPTFFYVPAETSDDQVLEQHFSLRAARDYVLFSLVPTREKQGTGTVYRQEGKDGPSFEELAATAEKAANWLRQEFKAYRKIKDARARVANDINRMAGGKLPREKYPLKYLSGRQGLTTFAAVIRADKGRALQATRYIESILKDSKTSFEVRFGGESPTYLGSGKSKGKVKRGPKGLQRQGELNPGEDSEYSCSDSESSSSSDSE